MARYRNWMGNWVYTNGFYVCASCWRNNPKGHRHCELKKGKSDEWGNECACMACYPEKHSWLQVTRKAYDLAKKESTSSFSQEPGGK